MSGPVTFPLQPLGMLIQPRPLTSYSEDMMTPWVSPVRIPQEVGVFEVIVPELTLSQYSHWNGHRWGFRCNTPELAFIHRKRRALGRIMGWRGFKEKQQ